MGVDETPEPSAAPEDRLRWPEAPTGGGQPGAATDLWPWPGGGGAGKISCGLPFTRNNPAMVQGRLEDEVLTLWVKDEFTKSMVGGASILEELGRLARLRPASRRAARSRWGRRPLPRPRGPPRRRSTTKLDDLLAFSRQFDNIIIQE